MSSRSQPQDNLVVWALTGPAGAGKSAVSKILERRGAAIVDGDRLGHELLQRAAIQAEISGRLGPEFVVDGKVDRLALGNRVFSDPEALATLNDITHGALAALATEKLAELAAAGQHQLAVFEAAVYFLLPSPPAVDLVVAVVVAPDVRVGRLVARAAGTLSEAQARRRVAAQDHLEKYWSRADELIVNDGTLAELEARIFDLVPSLRPGSETQP